MTSPLSFSYYYAETCLLSCLCLCLWLSLQLFQHSYNKRNIWPDTADHAGHTYSNETHCKSIIDIMTRAYVWIALWCSFWFKIEMHKTLSTEHGLDPFPFAAAAASRTLRCQEQQQHLKANDESFMIWILSEYRGKVEEEGWWWRWCSWKSTASLITLFRFAWAERL